jgi:hypothetical protein
MRMKTLKSSIILLSIGLFLHSQPVNAQDFLKKAKEKLGGKDSTEQTQDSPGTSEKKSKFNVMKTVGKLAGKLLTKTTADLGETAIMINYLENLPPAATDLTDLEYFGEEWIDGGNAVVLTFFGRSSVGVYKIDGTLKINGTEVPHKAMGSYGLFFEGNESANIEIATSSGQVYKTVVKPAPSIRVKSVNGRTSDFEVNVNEDLILELENGSGSEETEFSVSVLSDIMGVRSWLDLGIFKSADEITIPKEMFVNPSNVFGYNYGKTYMLIKRFTPELEENNTGPGAVMRVSNSMHAIPINLTGKVDENILGFTKTTEGIKIDEKKNAHDMKVELSKPNAFLGKPFQEAKTYALVSLSVRATQLQQSQSNTSVRYGANTKTTTTTTITRTFPQLPDAYWDNLVEHLYDDIADLVKNDLQAELIPMDRVLNAKAYQNLEPIEDENSTVKVNRSYKGTKNLIPTSYAYMAQGFNSTFAHDKPEARLCRELGVDGLIAVTLDLAMPWEEFTLQPRLSIRIMGEPNGVQMGPTVYLQGVVNGDGVPIDEAKLQSPSASSFLDTVVKREALIASLKDAIKDMKSQEEQLGYIKLWDLK